MVDHGPLGPVALHDSLHSALAATFKDLDLLDQPGLESLAQTDPLRKQTVEWYRDCRTRFEGHYTREELSRAASEAVRQQKVTATLRDLGTVVFFLLDRLSPAESDLINVLSGVQSCYMVLGLTGEEPSDATIMAAVAAVEPFFGAVGQVTTEGTVTSPTHVLSAPGAHEEIRWVVRDLARRAEAGTPFHKMAVFYRQAGIYGSLIRSQLQMAGFPSAGPDSSSLKDSPAGRLVSSLLSVYESDYGREAVMACAAETPIRNIGADGSIEEDLVHWETISRKSGVLKGLDQWRERISRHLGSLNARIAAAESREEMSISLISGLKETATSAGSLITFVESLAKQAPPQFGSNWGQFSKWCRDLVGDFGIHPNEWPEMHAASYERILQIIDDLAGLDDVTTEVDLKEFRATLDSALAVSAGRIGSTGSGVFVSSLNFGRGMEFDAVYLVGMSEGAFPPSGRDDPLFPDRIRAELDVGTSLPLRRSTANDERRSYIAAIASGNELTLSYARSEASSRQELHPSAWLLQSATALYGSLVSSKELVRLGQESWMTVVESLEHSLDFVATIGAADVHDFDVASVATWRRAGKSTRGHFLAEDGATLGRSLKMEQGRQSNAFTEWDGNLVELAGQSDKLGLPTTSEVSPTRLEQWAGCPYKYFLAYVLNVSSQERPEEILTISDMDRGNVIHDILEQFIVQTTGNGSGPGFGEPWKPEDRKLILQIAQSVFDNAEKSGITGKTLLWQAARAEITDDILGFIDADNRWRQSINSRPARAEMAFGSMGASSTPAMELTLPDRETLKFRGRIDRVDEVAGDKIPIVIDYKSGSSTMFDDMRDDPLGAGTHLQLPVYAMAMKQRSPGAEDVLAAYWFVSTRGNFKLSQVWLSDIDERFKEVVVTIASNIKKGLFPANPGTTSNRDGGPANCTYCDFDRICPSNRRLLWERKSTNLEISPYLALTPSKDGDESESR